MKCSRSCSTSYLAMHARTGEEPIRWCYSGVPDAKGVETGRVPGHRGSASVSGRSSRRSPAPSVWMPRLTAVTVSVAVGRFVPDELMGVVNGCASPTDRGGHHARRGLRGQEPRDGFQCSRQRLQVAAPASGSEDAPVGAMGAARARGFLLGFGSGKKRSRNCLHPTGHWHAIVMQC